MRILIIDNLPSRYDEFVRLLDAEKWTWAITCDPEFIFGFDLWQNVDAILLDHDMPIWNGVDFAEELAVSITEEHSPPVIITSCTSVPDAKETMRRVLESRTKVTINSADHLGCETEWLLWLKGAVA